jgi:catechol 2,3-dioxygenase-like lactoylglutathione lyase family enzyme
MIRGKFQRAIVAHCLTLAAASCATHGGSTMTKPSSTGSAQFSPGVTTAIVRYQVREVDRAAAFYTERLGFHLAQRPGAEVAIISRGDLHVILSGPESSGARPMPDGRRQEPGGWNRIVLYVENLDETLSLLKRGGAHFRNDIEVGPGGKQIQLDDPDGNPIELHEAPVPK